jgi:hypothetical protein
MPDIDRYFEEIDAARIRRARELSEIKRKFSADKSPDPAGVNSKAAIVLTYANWEGFYNECVRSYLQFLKERGGKVRDTDWMLLVGTFNRDFEALRTKNHSADAKRQFVADLKVHLDCRFDAFDSTVIEARSNLNFERPSHNYSVMNFDLTSIQEFRNRLDKELVGWRHSVAHGDAPDLTSFDIVGHVDFTAHLLIVIADHFQYAMVERM